jgi:hypothetical protein
MLAFANKVPDFSRARFYMRALKVSGMKVLVNVRMFLCHRWDISRVDILSQGI